jgi:Tol biopolymer transport system component
MPRVRALFLMAAAALGAACGGTDGGVDGGGAGGGLTEPPRPEVRVEAITAVALTGTVGTEVQPAPAVLVTDENDRPLEGVVITFHVADGAGAIPGATVTTGADGFAGVGKWTLGPAAGTNTLTAGAGGATDVVFTAIAAPGPLAQVTPVSGDDQIAGVGQSLQHRLVARAADALGNALAGIPVEFTVIAGGGSIEGAGAVLTGAEGLAVSGTWTLGAEAGEQQVRAVAGAVQGTFHAVGVPAPQPLEGRIAFETLADRDIAVVNADGSGFTQLPGPWIDLQPAWSPDGSRLAFTLDSQADEAVSLYTMTAQGGGRSRVTDGPVDGDPAWSPDGSTIAFSSLRDGSANVAALDVATGTITVLVDRPGYDAQPAWSPDGRRLAFVSDYAAYDFVFDIYLANADGTGVRQLTQGFRYAPLGLKYYLHPAWSPNGRMIAFVYGSVIGQRDMRFRVAVMSPEGVVLKDLAWAGDLAWNEVLDPGSLAWSPDGSGIAYSFVNCDLLSTLGCPRTRSVKYVALDGSREGTIVTDARNPSWTR